MSKYFKNFILCGDIQHYCLLCQEIFQNISDVEKHIRWEKHRKSLKTQAYIPKFRKDFIYRVESNYYCEICNFVSKDVAGLTDHINDEKHKSKKNNPNTETKNFIGQYESGFIVIKNVKLSKAQWNSIVDKKCLLCNTDIKNVDSHTALEEHVIKLIQSETKYEDERYYRKIHDDQYHCFTCKKIFSAQNFDVHWPDCENINETETKKPKEVGSSKVTETAKDDEAILTGLEKHLIGSMQKDYNIEEKDKIGTCKHCGEVIAVDFKAMWDHVKTKHNEQIKYVDIVDNGKRRAELKKYGKDNSIKLNFNGGKGYCLLCDRYLSAHKNIFQDHVNGAIHKGNLELQAQKNPKKQSTNQYRTKSILQCSLKYIPAENEFWINNDYSIDVYSFFLLHQIEGDPHFKKTKCYACVELFPQGQERDHCATPKHKNNFLAAKYVDINLPVPPEFIREIRPNFFHCGFCNMTFPNWTPLAHHLTSYNHLFLKEEKTEYVLETVKIKTKADDVYLKLLIVAFGNA